MLRPINPSDGLHLDASVGDLRLIGPSVGMFRPIAR